MENTVYNAIKESLENEGIHLVGVRFGEEDGMDTLFVTIDSENGVDTDLCVKATKIVSPIIDELDLDIEDFILDVGSEGIKENE